MGQQRHHRPARGRGATLVRVLTLLRILQSRKFGITVAEAVAELRVSRRTVYRDLAALQEAGFVLGTDRDGEVRWFLLPARDERDPC
jgi:predicted DNA-binding transcriptional regulator YafY